MEDEVAAVDKPMVYWDEEAQRFVYRASALMSCQNALLMARSGVQGVAPPEDLQKRFDEGHRQEPVVLAQLEDDFGFKCYAHQQELELNVGTGAMIRGHIDALSDLDGVSVTSWDGEERTAEMGGGDINRITGLIAVVDAKAFAPSTFKTWEKKRFESPLGLHYLWQQATYDYAGEFDAVVMACKDKVSGELRVDVFTTEWIKRRLPKATLMQRVLWVESQAKKGVLFDEVCSPKMFPCPYFPHHPGEELPEGDKIIVDTQLKTLTDALVPLDLALKQLKTDVEEQQTKIREHVGNKKFTPIKFRDATVSSYFSSSTGADWTAIAAATNLSVDDAKKAFSKTTTSSKLTISVKKKATPAAPKSKSA